MNAITVFDTLFHHIEGVSFCVKYWDKKTINYGIDKPAFTIIFKKPEALDEVLTHLSLGFGEAYTRGDIEIEGDIQRALGLLFDPHLKIRPSIRAILHIGWLQLVHKNHLKQARKNISHHYDVSNEFYDQWLGKERIYSCAYFKNEDDDIDTAQENKLDYICRKLLLKPGQTLLDIGCGWGALVLYAAKKYDVKVMGITLSKNQLERARKRAKQEGLSDKVTLELCDYRELATRNVSFDRIVSVGMMEHVGKNHIHEYMAANNKLLKENGVGLLHTIGKMKSGRIDAWMEKYIFPGAYLPEPGELIDGFRDAGLEVYHLENLRPHYALTLKSWVKNFEKNIETIQKLVSPELVRIYRLYLNGCVAAFTYGDINLYQISFCKGYTNQVPVPLTNHYLYV